MIEVYRLPKLGLRLLANQERALDPFGCAWHTAYCPGDAAGVCGRCLKGAGEHEWVRDDQGPPPRAETRYTRCEACVELTTEDPE